MKICFYIGGLGNGGAERVLSLLACQMSKVGHSVIVATVSEKDWEYPLENKITRVVFERNRKSGNWLLRNIKRIYDLRALCIKERPDVLISFMAESNFRALAATFGTKIKTIISIRSDPAKSHNGILAGLLSKTLYLRANGCVFQTEQARQWFLPPIQKKSRIIVNPISDDFFSVSESNQRKKHIVAVGRLVPEKNYPLLIDSFAMIATDYPDYKLLIFGDGFLREELKQRVVRLGMEDRILFEGQCNDVFNRIKDASLFVLSSDVEGLPNALMEAMVLGLPVVATDCSGGGVRTLVENGVNGCIVERDNKNELVSAMIKLLQDCDYRDQLGKNARMKGLSFNLESVTEQWLDYIKEILEH